MTNLTQLAAAGTKLDLTLAEVRGEVTVKRLRTRGPRKGETWKRGQAGGRPAADGNRPLGAHVACNGGWAANGQAGIGAQMVTDLQTVKTRYAAHAAAERKAAARDRAAGL